MTQSGPLPPRPAARAASSSQPPSDSILDANHAALQPVNDGGAAQAAPSNLQPSASCAVPSEPFSPPLAAHYHQQGTSLLPLQQRQLSPSGAVEPPTPFVAAAAEHYYQSLVRPDARKARRPSCVIAPPPPLHPPGLVLPLALPPGALGSTSESTSAGQFPAHVGRGSASWPHARLGSSGDGVCPAYPFRLTLMPCQPGSEVDNLLSLAANIFQVGLGATVVRRRHCRAVHEQPFELVEGGRVRVL